MWALQEGGPHRRKMQTTVLPQDRGHSSQNAIVAKVMNISPGTQSSETLAPKRGGTIVLPHVHFNKKTGKYAGLHKIIFLLRPRLLSKSLLQDKIVANELVWIS